MSSKKQKDQSLLINTRNSLEKKVKIKLEELYETIKKHDIAYYENHNPTISDAEYDEIRRLILEIEKDNPSLINSNSPSFRVGAEPSEKFKKVKHSTPMLSIQNAKNKEEVIAWSDSLRNFLRIDENHIIEYVAEPKIDGLSASLIYEDGVLKVGATRGNGKIGEDITENIKTIKGIPHTIDKRRAPKFLEIRGEVYMSHNNFNLLNELECITLSRSL